MSISTGVLRPMASKSSSDTRYPTRPAMAVRWMSALVDPPQACTTRRALSIERRLMIWVGRRPSAASCTARLPVCSASRRRSACTAGTQAAPGSIMPIASAANDIVLAVPITEQVPTVGANRLLTWASSATSMSPARKRAQ